MREHVEIRHGFELVLETEDCTLADKLLICNAFDGYEVVRGVSDILIVDVLEFIDNRLVLRVSLKEPLTYKEINDYLEDMLDFAAEQTNYHVNMKAAGVKWDVKTPGMVSERFDESLLISHPHRKEILEKMDIRLQTERARRSKPKYDLVPGMCYISREKKSERAFEIFTDLVTHEMQGLCITRSRPDLVREKHGLKKTPVVWLTQNSDPGEKCIAPTDIPKLHIIIIDFLEKAANSCILLDGLEYLITHNSFPSALKLIQLLNDKVMLHKSRMIVPADPAAVGDKEWALLERDMRTLPEN